VILVVEKSLPSLSLAQCKEWAAMLAPAFNIVRFYEALPVLLLTDSNSFRDAQQPLLECEWNCVVCPDISASKSAPAHGSLRGSVGIAAPLDLFAGKSGYEPSLQLVREAVTTLSPVLVSTAGDLPPDVDVRHAAEVFGQLRQV